MTVGAAFQQLRMSEVISALSYALDITEGQPPGHAIRSCLIGMRLADELGLADEDRSSLFYALLLKDAGCSSNAAKICKLFRGDDLRLKQGVKSVDWTSFSENLIWAVRNVAPEGSPLARAATLVRLGLQQGTPKEIFETRCERGADIARELGFSEPTAGAIRTGSSSSTTRRSTGSPAPSPASSTRSRPSRPGTPSMSPRSVSPSAPCSS